jgi:hypothetical protein
MKGGSQSQLILGEDENLWVVKFQNNPQHIRVLANELIATRIAEEIGLSVPKSCIVDVGLWLIESNPQLSIDLGGGRRERCASGLQYGSQFAGGMTPRSGTDFLPDNRLPEVTNLGQFAGMLALDKWTANSDVRQAVFQQSMGETGYHVVFIDQGGCFEGGEWRFHDAPLQGAFARNSVYALVQGWESFEPWLSRIEQFKTDVLLGIADSVPSEWYGGDRRELVRLVQRLIKRRPLVRELIEQFRLSSRTPFPCWKNGAAVPMFDSHVPHRSKTIHAMAPARLSSEALAAAHLAH